MGQLILFNQHAAKHVIPFLGHTRQPPSDRRWAKFLPCHTAEANLVTLSDDE